MSKKKKAKSAFRIPGTAAQRRHKHYKLAISIIDKFVDKRKINYFRDLSSAFKLVRKFPSKFFWKQLPCEFKIKNLSIFLFGAALEKLEMLWNVYQNKLAVDKKIKTEKVTQYKIGRDKCGEDYKSTSPVKSILDFIKNP